MNWNDISATYGEFITKDIDDTRTYPCELQIFFESSEDADRALNKISSAIAAQLRPTNEGPSDQSGARRYHVVPSRFADWGPI